MSTKKSKFTCTACQAKTPISATTMEIVVVTKDNKPVAQTTFACGKCNQKIPFRIPVKSVEMRLDYDT